MNAVYEAWGEDAAGIHKTFVFKDFRHAIAFVSEIALLAEAADHHPDIDIRWNKVILTLMTHSVRKVTAKDRAMAGQIDRIAVEQVEKRISLLF